MADAHSAAVGLLLSINHYLERLSLPTVTEAAETLARDLLATEHRTHSPALAPWQDWYRRNISLIEMATDAREARDVLTQTAVEHADDSPVTASAERWFAGPGRQHWHLRNRWRPDSWTRASGVMRTFIAGAPPAPRAALITLSDDALALLRSDGVVVRLDVRTGARVPAEASGVVAIGSGPGASAIALTSGGEVLRFAGRTFGETRLGRVDFAATEIASVGDLAVVCGAGRAAAVREGQPATPLGAERETRALHAIALDHTRIALWSPASAEVWNATDATLVHDVKAAPDATIADVVPLEAGSFMVLERSKDAAAAWAVLTTFGHGGDVVARAELQESDNLPVRIAPRRDGGVWLGLSCGRTEARALDGATIDDERSASWDGFELCRLLETDAGTLVTIRSACPHALADDVELPAHPSSLLGAVRVRDGFATWDEFGLVRVWSSSAKFAQLPPEADYAGKVAAQSPFAKPQGRALGPLEVLATPGGCHLARSTDGALLARWASLDGLLPEALNPDGTLGLSGPPGAAVSVCLEIHRGNRPCSVDELLVEHAMPELDPNEAASRMCADHVAQRTLSSVRGRGIAAALTPLEEKLLRIRLGVAPDDPEYDDNEPSTLLRLGEAKLEAALGRLALDRNEPDEGRRRCERARDLFFRELDSQSGDVRLVTALLRTMLELAWSLGLEDAAPEAIATLVNAVERARPTLEKEATRVRLQELEAKALKRPVQPQATYGARHAFRVALDQVVEQLVRAGRKLDRRALNALEDEDEASLTKALLLHIQAVEAWRVAHYSGAKPSATERGFSGALARLAMVHLALERHDDIDGVLDEVAANPELRPPVEGFFERLLPESDGARYLLECLALRWN